VIGRFWVVHHRFFGEVTGFDGRLLALNIFYLGWIVLIPFSSSVLGDHGGDTAAIVLYAVNLAGTVLVGSLMFGDAQRAGLARHPPEEAREFRLRSAIIAVIFLISIPVALIDPGVAQFVWLALLFEPLLRGAVRA
jgi:TMEM175 potassium channel family protein